MTELGKDKTNMDQISFNPKDLLPFTSALVEQQPNEPAPTKKQQLLTEIIGFYKLSKLKQTDISRIAIPGTEIIVNAAKLIDPQTQRHIGYLITTGKYRIIISPEQTGKSIFVMYVEVIPGLTPNFIDVTNLAITQTWLLNIFKLQFLAIVNADKQTTSNNGIDQVLINEFRDHPYLELEFMDMDSSILDTKPGQDPVFKPSPIAFALKTAMRFQHHLKIRNCKNALESLQEAKKYLEDYSSPMVQNVENLETTDTPMETTE